MASPTYGTNLSNYMNILAGQARGMNESERLSRMQEKQDYSQAFNMLQYEDRIGNRDAQQQQNYDWNAYNANLRQQNAQQDYDWNVYRDSLRQEQRGYQRGRDTINDAARKEALEYNRNRQGRQDAMRKQEFERRMNPPRKPLGIDEYIESMENIRNSSPEVQRILGITEKNDFKPDSWIWDAMKTSAYYSNPLSLLDQATSYLGGSGRTGGVVHRNLFDREGEEADANLQNALREKKIRDLARR